MCEAIKKGQLAYEAGLFRGNNPYMRGTHNYVMWLSGWRKAEALARDRWLIEHEMAR